MLFRTSLTLALCGFLGLSGAALAQSSTGAPAGSEPATAPGGTEGSAGLRNEREAIRDGDAVAVPPRRAGIAVDAPPPAMEQVAPPPSRP